MPFDRLLVLTTLVGVAGVQCLAHPFEHLVVKIEPAKQLGEPRFERFLAYILAPAGSRVIPALIPVPGAMIIDVALLLNLADHRRSRIAHLIRPEKAKSCLPRLAFLAKRPSSTP